MTKDWAKARGTATDLELHLEESRSHRLDLIDNRQSYQEQISSAYHVDLEAGRGDLHGPEETSQMALASSRDVKVHWLRHGI